MSQIPKRDGLTRIGIVGAPVDVVDMPGAINEVRNMLANGSTHLIFAINPEKVIAAQRDPALLNALRNASMIIPDGIGIVMAARMLRKGRMGRVPGSDLMPAICKLAADEGYGIFLYGAKPTVVSRAAEILQQNYPKLRISGFHHGYVSDEEMPQLVNNINASGADVLFVGLGSPRQEFWMDSFRTQLKVRVCQGVGGTFDALCGNPKRAPDFIQSMHLEWLYRLLTQPKRLRRQSALPIFMAQVFRDAFTRK